MAPGFRHTFPARVFFRACLHGGGGPQVGEVTRPAVVEKENAFRACLHGCGGPQVSEVTRLAVVEKINAFTCNLTTPGRWGEVS